MTSPTPGPPEQHESVEYGPVPVYGTGDPLAIRGFFASEQQFYEQLADQEPSVIAELDAATSTAEYAQQRAQEFYAQAVPPDAQARVEHQLRNQHANDAALHHGQMTRNTRQAQQHWQQKYQADDQAQQHRQQARRLRRQAQQRQQQAWRRRQTGRYPEQVTELEQQQRQHLRQARRLRRQAQHDEMRSAQHEKSARDHLQQSEQNLQRGDQYLTQAAVHAQNYAAYEQQAQENLEAYDNHDLREHAATTSKWALEKQYADTVAARGRAHAYRLLGQQFDAPTPNLYGGGGAAQLVYDHAAIEAAVTELRRIADSAQTHLDQARNERLALQQNAAGATAETSHAKLLQIEQLNTQILAAVAEVLRLVLDASHGMADLDQHIAVRFP